MKLTASFDRSSFLTTRMAGIAVRAPAIEDDDSAARRRPPDAQSKGAANEPQRIAKTIPHGKRTGFDGDKKVLVARRGAIGP